MPPIVSGGGGFSSYLRTDFPAGPPVPALIQHVASSANPVGISGFAAGHTGGDNFKIPLPNAVGAGNCLVLWCTYPNSNTASVSDTNGNTWPAAAITVDAGVGGNKSSCFVLPNANAGLTTVTVTFGADTCPFQYTLTEYNNIATSSPVNGTIGAASVTGPSLACGSFTPGNNNANGGNLICAYFPISGAAGSNPTGWAPGTSFTLLNGDIAWTTGQGFPHASEYFVQTTSAAINPGITATGDTVDSYNCAAVALKVASAGNGIPAGIHINAIHHFTNVGTTNVTTWKLHVPFTGNLRAMFTNETGVINITGIVDSDGNTWTKYQPSADEPQCWYKENTTANPNATVTLTISGTPARGSPRFFDIQGAAVSPIGAEAATPSHGVSSTTVVTNQPTITPQAANSLIINAGILGQGPGLAVTSPAGAIWDLCTYSFEIDVDNMENADLLAHYYNSSTAAENWNWTITSIANNTSAGIAVEFKAA